VLGTSRRGVRYRASGLNLLRSAVVLWNTVYMEREVSVCALREHGQTVDETLRQYLSPLGWEHINLMGERSQAQAGQISAVAALRRGLTCFKFRFLRGPIPAYSCPWNEKT
jgi:hypothetical protein